MLELIDKVTEAFDRLLEIIDNVEELLDLNLDNFGELSYAFVTPLVKQVTKISWLKDGAYYCYCAYVLRISRYSDFLSPMLTNTGIFLRGLKLSGESRS